MTPTPPEDEPQSPTLPPAEPKKPRRTPPLRFQPPSPAISDPPAPSNMTGSGSPADAGNDPTTLTSSTTRTTSYPDFSDPAEKKQEAERRRLFEANKRGLKRLLKKTIRTASGVPNRFLTTYDERELGLYLADETDEEDIAEPLAGVLARRGVVVGSSDIADALELVVAVGAYLVRQIALRAEIRRGERALEDPAA